MRCPKMSISSASDSATSTSSSTTRTDNASRQQAGSGGSGRRWVVGTTTRMTGAAFGRHSLDRAPMRGQHVRQTERPMPVLPHRLGREVGLEDAVSDIRRDAWPVVADLGRPPCRCR